MELATHIATVKTLTDRAIKNFDTIYLGDPTCPKFPGNISSGNDLDRAVDRVKKLGKKCYLSLYAVPRTDDFKWMETLIEKAEKLPIDGFEVHNMGLLRLIKSKDIHAGLFINLYTKQTADLLKQFGTSRVFPNPELALEEIDIIKKSVQITMPINGNIPLGISDHCFFIDELKMEGSCETLCRTPKWLKQDEWQLGNIGRAPISGYELCMAEYMSDLLKSNYQFFYIYSFRRDEVYLETASSIYRDLIEGKIDEIYAVRELSMLAKFGLCNGYFFKQSGYKYISKRNKEAI